MSQRRAKGRAYKDTTFQQLRSFYETARLGSLSAAAASLGMAQPTVSQQVHALERQLGDQLVEPFGRGSRLTEAGRLLAELIGPAVLSISSLKQAYHEARGQLPDAARRIERWQRRASAVSKHHRRAQGGAQVNLAHTTLVPKMSRNHHRVDGSAIDLVIDERLALRPIGVSRDEAPPQQAEESRGRAGAQILQQFEPNFGQ